MVDPTSSQFKEEVIPSAPEEEEKKFLSGTLVMIDVTFKSVGLILAQKNGGGGRFYTFFDICDHLNQYRQDRCIVYDMKHEYLSSWMGRGEAIIISPNGERGAEK